MEVNTTQTTDKLESKSILWHKVLVNQLLPYRADRDRKIGRIGRGGGGGGSSGPSPPPMGGG